MTFLFPVGRKTWDIYRYGMLCLALGLLGLSGYLVYAGHLGDLLPVVVAFALIGVSFVGIALTATDSFIQKLYTWLLPL